MKAHIISYEITKTIGYLARHEGTVKVGLHKHKTTAM